MGLFDYLRYAAQNQQQPDMGTLNWGPAAPASPQPAAFTASPLSWQDQLAGAIDYSTAGGDAWNTIGRDGVIGYMGDSLMKRYGTNNLSDFRYVAKEGVPGGYQLDWRGRQPVTGLVGGLKDLSRSIGVASGAPAGDASDGSMMEAGNPADALNFGATWEGEGGTTFGFYRKPDGSVGIKTNQTQSNETGDIIAALAILGGGYMAGTGALGGAAAGGAAEGAAAAGAAEGAAAGSAAGAAGGSTAAMGAGAADLGMAGFGQIGIPSAIPAGAGYGTLGTTALSAPVSTFGGSAIGSGLAGSLAAGAGGFGGGGATGATGSVGGSSTPGTFNPAMDSQAANAAIEAGGGDALSAYTSAPTASSGTSLFDSLANKVGNMEMKDWLGLASTVGGAISGGQGQKGSSSSTRAMDPRMDALFYGDLAPRTQGLLSSTVPQAQLAGAQLLTRGSGLLGQTAPNTATNPYATGILDDMQRRVGQFTDQRLQGIRGNSVGYGGLGGSRQGVAEAEAIKGGADNFAGQGFNFMGGLYNQDQNRLRQDWTLGAGLMGQGVNMPFLPAQNASQIFAPFTGFGTTTNNTQSGGGWQGALGGALSGAAFGKQMGWWG